MNKFEKEQSMALMVGDDLSRPCHNNSGKLRAAKSIKVREERLKELGFEPVSDDQKANNMLCFELYTLPNL